MEGQGTIIRATEKLTQMKISKNNQTRSLIDLKKKGYSLEGLAKLKAKITQIDREDLLVQKNIASNNHRSMAFNTGFNTQYKKFEFILKKYWPKIFLTLD